MGRDMWSEWLLHRRFGDDKEIARFVAHLRPIVEAHQRVHRSAVAYLWAVK